MNTLRTPSLLLGLAVVMLCAAAPSAENTELPANSGVINVVKDRGIDNTGTLDVTDTLTTVLKSVNAWRTIYLPAGTYKVSGPVAAMICTGSETTRGPIIMGQGRGRTVIRLVDGTWPTPLTMPSTASARAARVVLNGGECRNVTFNHGLHNLTVNVGRNNAGAIGVRFNSSNNGCMSEVDIVSEDGQGMIGLDLGGQENGPLYVRHVSVTGFRWGVFGDAQLTATLSQIRVQNQSEYGVVCGYRTYIDSLASVNSVTALYSRNGTSSVVLINASLTGGSSTVAAIRNEGSAILFARNIHTQGYQRAVTSSSGSVAAPTGNAITEYSSHGSTGLFFTPGTSMNLPVKYPPIPEWDPDTSKWISALTIKGTGFGARKTDQEACTLALAMPGKTGVIISGDRTWSLTDTVRVRGAISRVVGTPGSLGGAPMVIEDGSSPVVMVQRITGIPIIVRTSRTVILESVQASTIYAEGTGDLFINDRMGDVEIVNGRQRIWMRQLNLEFGGRCGTDHSCCLLDVPRGVVWVFGYKTEGNFCKASISGNAFLEILGLLEYQQENAIVAGVGLFDITDAQFCAAGVTQVNHNTDPAWMHLVNERRNGELRTITTGGYLPLYTGYDPAVVSAAAAKPHVPAHSWQGRCATRLTRFGIFEVTLPATRRVMLRLTDMLGRSRICMAGDEMRAVKRFDLSKVAPGAYAVEVIADGAIVHRTSVAMVGK